ncbi:MAG: YbhB/YbcL family Raf kinase inhibitor-like protein [archaeon]
MKKHKKGKVQVALWVIAALLLSACSSQSQQIITKANTTDTMKLTSPAFSEGQPIPAKFTCMSFDVNPQLTVSDHPKGTKSFALLMDDPDAPMETWTHWIVKDIPADTALIHENSVPGEQLENSFGKEDYGGPCPPRGKPHRYFFKLYALKVDKLDAQNAREFAQEVQKQKLAEATLMGTFQKE